MSTISEKDVVSFGADSVVIRNYVGGIVGGKALDCTGYTEDVINAGHLVIRDTINGTYKPMPLNESKTGYAAKPENHEYAGVVVASKPTAEPLVGIMYAGEVNDKAVPYSVDSLKAAIKADLPALTFLHD